VYTFFHAAIPEIGSLTLFKKVGIVLPLLLLFVQSKPEMEEKPQKSFFENCQLLRQIITTSSPLGF